MKVFYLLPCFALLLSLKGISQDSAAVKTTSYFKSSLTYQNDQVYLGRKDSVRLPYLSLAAGYYLRSGIYFQSTISYVSTESRIDVVSLGAGYSVSKNKWTVDFSVEKDFYSNGSYSVKSEQYGTASASFSYETSILTPKLDLSLGFAKKSDYSASPGIEHEFDIFDGNLSLTPSFVMNASTDHYYDLYYQNRKYKQIKRGKAPSSTITAKTNATGFKIMDYELAAPIAYQHHNLTINFAPTYDIPVHPESVSLTIVPKTGPVVNQVFTETLHPSFFWSLGIEIKL